MKLRLVRTLKTNKSTIGDLSIDNSWFCYILERVEQQTPENEGGPVAIPKGTYDVVVDWSNKFQRNMPHILAVPGRTGIRIHPGNFPKDSVGCLIPGATKGEDCVAQSKITFEKLFRLLDGEQGITLEII